MLLIIELNQNYISHYSYLVSFDKALNIDEGMTNLNIGANMTGRTPIPRQIKCSCCVNGTVLRD